MKNLVDEVVSLAKRLPGFSLAFLIVTLVYMYTRGSENEPSLMESIGISFVCWVLYRAASELDRIYDSIYGPDRTFPFLWKSSALGKARNRASAALFGRIDPLVQDYSSAKQRGYVGAGSGNSLYSLSKTVAGPTDVWHKKIAPKIDVSKAARTVFAFASVAALIIRIPSVERAALPYTQRLGVLSDLWFLCTVAVVTLLAYVGLRVQHNLELYDYVAKEVTHVPLGDSRAAAMIFEVVVARRST